MKGIKTSRYVAVGAFSGILFGIMDGLINANPLAQKLYGVYQPIAKASVNVFAGVAVDIAYGFAMAAIFALLYKSLPGRNGLAKGVGFALLAWFFRVLMAAISSWMTLELPMETLLYSVLAGLAEMLILGVLYGLMLKPRQEAEGR